MKAAGKLSINEKFFFCFKFVGVYIVQPKV